ncbi:hypothetical protein AOC23_07625 [Polynucleobacter paneuropaeus]|jgi:hypothetical protein|uniref:hypothetical protein n=1 Tax=Polynucleobacter paneuropaeus TaxID=2527775 RepID=UPI001BFEAC11|nr:hypothetical protein [Polynucleobacter paneuropaeus]MBT8631936.1 hypothetical protein [Polynucleobacter paneuropaeus]
MNNFEIHFFTIVINGRPFIEKHIDNFNSLSIKWHWHIVEGIAELKYDTAWSLANGGRIPERLHRDGLSIDGTSEYIDKLKTLYPTKISVYRKPVGQFWNGKLEMVNAPLAFIKKECLLWQIDVDEFWTTEQISVAYQMFQDQPKKFVAFYWCHYFVGPNLLLLTRYGYANNPKFEWQRTWRFKPHFFWAAHEPPTLVERDYSGRIRPVMSRGVFTHEETEEKGLIFQHFAYVTPSQLIFKESYYGYKNALADWEKLQSNTAFPARLADYFTWVGDDTLVGKTSSVGIKPIIKL